MALAEVGVLLELGKNARPFRIPDELHGTNAATALEVAMLLERLELPPVHVAGIREAFECSPVLADQVNEETHPLIAKELHHAKTKTPRE